MQQPQIYTCQMIHPGHPDDPNGEHVCGQPAAGITEVDVHVCLVCGRRQRAEGFIVMTLPERQRDLLFPFAQEGDRFRFSYPLEPQFNVDLTVGSVTGLQPEDHVFFSDGTHTKQKHIGKLERLT